MELHDRDLPFEDDGGVALGLEEVLNTETVLISADLYSCFMFFHVENFVVSHIRLAYGRQSSGQSEEQWSVEQQFGIQVNVVYSCPKTWLT